MTPANRRALSLLTAGPETHSQLAAAPAYGGLRCARRALTELVVTGHISSRTGQRGEVILSLSARGRAVVGSSAKGK